MKPKAPGAGQQHAASHDESLETKFKFVFGSLVDLYKWSQSLARDIVVFSLLVIGWLVTSKYSRGYISSNKQVLYISFGVMATIFGLYLLENWRIRRESVRKMAQLEELGFTDRAYYENYEVRPAMLCLAIALVAVVFSLVCAVLLTV